MDRMELATVAILAALVAGCGASQVRTDRRTLPDPVVSVELPSEPVRPDGGVSTVPVDKCFDSEGQETSGGILFSDETAAYVSHLRVSYDEMRDLYAVDQRTWGNEREVYRRHIGLADDEIDRANDRAERGWFERHDGTIGLMVGIVIGAAVAVGIAAGIQEVRR